MDMPGKTRRFGQLSRRSALLFGLVAFSGCTVQPLHQTDPGNAFGGAVPHSNVAVADVNDRVTQQVRNHLVFLLHQGSSVDPRAEFTATITAVPIAQDVFVTTAPDGTTQVSARRIALTGTITLTRNSDGTVIVSQTRSATASFDRTRQEFANLRAERDAQNRAAIALAEQFRLVIATALTAG